MPKVVGGVQARWHDAAGDELRADDLDELREAYERGQTAIITISGYVNNPPRCFLRYWPVERRAFVEVEASNNQVASELVDSVRVEFPLTKRAHPEWDSLSLTLAGIVYTVVLTITGVLIAQTSGWLWSTIWGLVGTALLVLGLTALKPRVIRWSERFLQPERWR